MLTDSQTVRHLIHQCALVGLLLCVCACALNQTAKSSNAPEISPCTDCDRIFEVPLWSKTKLPPKDVALAFKDTSLTQTGRTCVPAGLIKRKWEKKGESL